MQEVHVFGHKNPDTDSICAAIAYAYLKNILTEEEHIPNRLGDISAETQYVLKTFNVREPELIHHIMPQVSDTKYYPTPCVTRKDSISVAWQLMEKSEFSLIPVINDEGKFEGVVSTRDITEEYMNLLDPNFLSIYGISVEQVAEVLNARILTGEAAKDDVPGKLIIYNHELEDISTNDIIIVSDIITHCAQCIDSLAKYIILSGSYSYNEIEKMTVLAMQRGKLLIYTQDSLFAITRSIAQALPISAAFKNKEIIVFHPNSTIDDVKAIMLKKRYRYFPIIDLDNRPLGLISRKQLMTYRRKKVILVDHNEISQTVDGIDQADILEIIDHHRLGSLQTSGPLSVNCRAVGSTCTLIADEYFKNNIIPSYEMAGIMLSAVISDTLLFRSPTSTLKDEEIAYKLAQICNKDIYEYGNEMLRAGGSIKNMTVSKILKNDAKQYEIGKHKIYTAQVFTTDIEEMKTRISEIEEEALSLENKMGYDCIILIVTDYLKQGSEILIFGSAKELVRDALEMENRTFFDGILSRKNQIIPKLVLNLGW